MLTGREVLIKNGNAPDARIHQLESEVAMLREELRIHSAACGEFRPIGDRSTPGLERMAILQLRVMRGWNKAETSRHFLVSDDTIRDWLRRVDDDACTRRRSDGLRTRTGAHHRLAQRTPPSRDVGRQDAQRSARLPPTLSFPTQTSVKAEAGFFASPETSFVDAQGSSAPPE